MHYLRLQIVRFVDEHQPGWVAGVFTDAEGVQHTIIDKVPVLRCRTCGAIQNIRSLV